MDITGKAASPRPASRPNRVLRRVGLLLWEFLRTYGRYQPGYPPIAQFSRRANGTRSSP
jgi:hypothetical protein